MAFVGAEQSNARLTAAVRIDVAQGRDGPVSKGTAVTISSVRKQGGEEEATSDQARATGLRVASRKTLDDPPPAAPGKLSVLTASHPKPN